MQGTDTLHLINVTNVQEIKTESKTIIIYPNPVDHDCNFEFFNATHGMVNIQLYNVEGRIVHLYCKELPQGLQSFQLSGVPSGFYVMSIQTETEHFACRFVSTSGSDADFSLKHTNESQSKKDLIIRNTKSNKTVENMDFELNDQLRFVGYATGFDNDTINTSPGGHQTITFVFFPEGFQCGVSNVTFIYNGTLVTYGTVVGANNRCWLDRNLGASLVATNIYNPASLGDLFQRGRAADGHQIRNPLSNTTTILSNNDNPGHNNFILVSNSPYDWRSPQNGSLWQGVDGINNPCPPGWRLPSEEEWETERQSWNSNSSDGAINSPLKLPMAGYRITSSGALQSVSSQGRNWSSSLTNFNGKTLHFYLSYAGWSATHRGVGASVRCIKHKHNY